MPKPSNYEELKPRPELENFVHSFWMHSNMSEEEQNITIVPDSFLKIVFFVQSSKVVQYFTNGLWTQPMEVTIPPDTTTYGCRLKILAPEYLLDRELASVYNSRSRLPLSFLNIEHFAFGDFEVLVDQWQNELSKQMPKKQLNQKKRVFSKLLYEYHGNITISELSKKCFWSSRQMNRYFNKYIGVSVKAYLMLQRTYHAYSAIREGNFSIAEGFYDQAHLIRNIKRHTGQTPRALFKGQNDRFIQLKNIKRE